MTDALHHVTRAALPVAIALLSFALAARAVLWAQIDHAPARRIARQYLEPLSTWCLIATGVYTLALGLRGDAELVAFVFPVVIGIGAVLLRPAAEPSRDEPEPEPAAPVPASSPQPAPPAPAGLLWSRHQ
jgi:hypothetical protein